MSGSFLVSNYNSNVQQHNESIKPFFRSMLTSTFSGQCSSWSWSGQHCHPDQSPSDLCVRQTTNKHILIPAC